MEIDERDLNASASKLRRFGNDFTLHESSIRAYEAAKEKRLRGECPTCKGTGTNPNEYPVKEEK